MSRYSELVKRVREALLREPARISPTVRRILLEGGDACTATAVYLDKLRRYAHKITDEDVAALRAAGWDDEALYELTVTAAVGQGLRRLDLGMAALRAAQQKAGR